jgi:hypothetical protein
VRWLLSQGHAADEGHAAALGNALLQAGLLHHVAYEHTFKNADALLYKWAGLWGVSGGFLGFWGVWG